MKNSGAAHRKFVNYINALWGVPVFDPILPEKQKEVQFPGYHVRLENETMNDNESISYLYSGIILIFA